MQKITHTYYLNDHNFPCNNPTADRLYVKYIRHISDHPGCLRREVMNAVDGTNYLPGESLSHPTEWVSILAAGLCEMCRDGRNIRYFITEKGRAMLNNLAA